MGDRVFPRYIKLIAGILSDSFHTFWSGAELFKLRGQRLGILFYKETVASIRDSL